MKSSVVNIESVSNSSFGTGFVIDSDERGVYILTCGHVVAKGEFVDIAVLYVSRLHLSPLLLQVDECDSLDIEVIGWGAILVMLLILLLSKQYGIVCQLLYLKSLLR